MSDTADYHVVTTTYGGVITVLRNFTLPQARALKDQLWEDNRALIPCFKSDLFHTVRILGPEGFEARVAGSP